MSDKMSFEHEQEALAALDKIKENFAANSPGESVGLDSETEMAVANIFKRSREEHEEISEPNIGTGTSGDPVPASLEAEREAPKAEPEVKAAPAKSEQRVVPGRAARKEKEKEKAADAGKTKVVPAAAVSADTTAIVPAEKKLPEAVKTEEAELEEEPKKAKEKKPKKEKKKKKHIFLKIILALFLLVVVVVIGAVGYAGSYVYKVIQEAPEINPNNIYNILSENSTVYDVDGNVLTNLYDKNEGLRNNVDYADLPENLKNAFISIEDKTFWDHNGFNIVRIIGAVWNSAKSGFSTKIQGTSTITQQLARNIFLPTERLDRNIDRKIREAYYTLLIERALSKEQILEAYLNTVYLGFNTNGVGAAAKAYFNKDVKDLTLVECAALAGLPQNPVTFAPLKRVSTKSISDSSSYDIVSQTDAWTIYYNNAGEGRTRLVLKQMYDQGRIDETTYNTAKAETVRPYLNPGMSIEVATETTYMTDYVVSRVLAELQSELKISYSEAYEMLYTGGLQIYTTIDMRLQSIVDETFQDKSLFPKISLKDRNIHTDEDQNILNDDRDRVMLYNKSILFDEKGNFILKEGDFKWKSNGDLLIPKGGKFNIYKTTIASGTDIAVYIKDMYFFEDDLLYSISNCYFDIPSKYKDRDTEGNLIISAAFMKDYPNAFMKQEDGTLKFTESMIVMKTPIIQPQSAMVIIENSTGYMRAMIGGRNISGSLLFNRATATRQPGSSIKPLAVYSTALQKGLDNARLGVSPVFTAAYAVDDAPNYAGSRLWPRNVYAGYRGITYLRNAVEQSINACAVNVFLQLDPMDSISNLEKMGVTSIVKTGNINDINAGALAIGGMTKGISPLEMASAYSTFGNYGTHIETTCFTKIVNKRGETIIDKTPKETQVYEESVASLMLDILRTTVTNGIASGARLKSQPSAGKTGTTNEMYDLWFCGLTPKYAASLWLGCDTNVSLGTTSGAATKVWQAVMEKVGELDERGQFELKGNFVTSRVDKKTGMLPSELTPEEDIRSEIFISGTQPKESGNRRQSILVCAETGYLATPNCPSGYKNCIQRPGGLSWEGMLNSFPINVRGWSDAQKTSTQASVKDYMYDIPDFYCPIHNPDPSTYPISPLVTESTLYYTENIEYYYNSDDDDDTTVDDTTTTDNGGGGNTTTDNGGAGNTTTGNGAGNTTTDNGAGNNGTGASN